MIVSLGVNSPQILVSSIVSELTMELRVLLSKKDSLSDRSNLKQRHNQSSWQLSVYFCIGWSQNPEVSHAEGGVALDWSELWRLMGHSCCEVSTTMVHGVLASLTGVVFLWRRCATGAWCSLFGVPLHEDEEAPGFYWPESWSSGWRSPTAWLRKPITDSVWTYQSVASDRGLFHHQNGNNQTTF